MALWSSGGSLWTYGPGRGGMEVWRLAAGMQTWRYNIGDEALEARCRCSGVEVWRSGGALYA